MWLRDAAGWLHRSTKAHAGASGPAAGSDDQLALAKGEIPEDRLVDLAIDLFSPGINDADPSPLLKKGIRAAVRTYDFSAWFQRLQEGDFDLSLGWSFEGPTPYLFYRWLMSSATVIKLSTSVRGLIPASL